MWGRNFKKSVTATIKWDPWLCINVTTSLLQVIKCGGFWPGKELFKAKKKKCVFTVRRPTLIFGLDPNHFYGTFSRKLNKYPIFAFQGSFWCQRDHYFDKNELNVTLQM